MKISDKIPWQSFCDAKSEVGILSFDIIVRDCKSVEIPPKPITNDDAQIAKNLL